MRRISLFCIAAALLFTANNLADYRLPGGDTTIFDASREAFAQPAENLDPRSLARFFSGDTLFNTNWVNASSVVRSRDGLGPLFNARSCSACHMKDGRGRPPEKDEIPSGFLIRISVPGKTDKGGPLPHPVYGNQLSIRALPGLKPEAMIKVEYEETVGNYPDGLEYRIQKPRYTIENLNYGDIGTYEFSPRVAPSVFGLGLIDLIPNADLLAKSDPHDNDKDGISGRPNWVWSPSKKGRALGKYGWKANQASIVDQTAAAFQGDIGITSSLFPTENHSPRLLALKDLPSGGDPEIPDRDLEDVVFYLHTLAPPASRFESASKYEEGFQLFTRAQCTSCHTPSFQTGKSEQFPALSNQTIYPYTDLLLHDMGEGLADNRNDFEATGREWRTPPLWGIGLIPTVNGHSRLLHDGRARSIEEAILWHGGEAAKSKQAFENFTREERAALCEFIESL